MSAYALFKQLQRLHKSIRQQQYTMIKRGTDALCYGYTDFFKEINGKYCFNAPPQDVRIVYNPRKNKLLCYKFWFDMHPTATLKQALKSFREDLDFYIFISRFRPAEFIGLIPYILCKSIINVKYWAHNYGIHVLRYICRNYSNFPAIQRSDVVKKHRFWIDNDIVASHLQKNLEYLMKHNVIQIPRDQFIIKGLIFYDMDLEGFQVLNFKFALWAAKFVDYRTKVKILGCICNAAYDHCLHYDRIKEFNRHYQII